MQPRQRSKCCATVAFSAIVPSSRASIRWMRPRGESISSRQSTYVGHVGRQNPQWTQSDVYSRITRRGLRAGRARRAIAIDEALPRRLVTPSSPGALGRVGDARRRGGRRPRRGPPASSASSPGAKRARPRAVAWRARDSSQTDASASSPPTRLCAVAIWAATARSEPSNSTATRPGWRTSSALGCSCEREKLPATPAASLRLDDERARRPRQRVEAEADACDEGEASLGAADEPREVVAGDVLHDLAARVRDRPVREDERRAEDEVARRAEAVAERARDVAREERADRRVAGRVERQPLAARRRAPRELREPDPRLDRAREVAGIVLEHAVQPVGRQVRRRSGAGARRRARPRRAPRPPRC